MVTSARFFCIVPSFLHQSAFFFLLLCSCFRRSDRLKAP
ncbi:unnamed protein product [Brassica rapa subsp. narinosa]